MNLDMTTIRGMWEIFCEKRWVQVGMLFGVSLMIVGVLL